VTAVHVAWVEALLASLWQAPVIAALAWLVEQAFAERASSRHAIRAAALMATPAALVATWLGWLPGIDSQAGFAGLPSAGVEPSSLLAASPITTTAIDPPRWLAWILAAWLFGMLLMAARTAMQWRSVQTLRRTAAPLPAAWAATVDALARSLGIRPPRVALSSACETPLVLGLLRPLVLLPAGLLHGVPREVIEAALAHELMHLRRLDPWLHAAQVAVEILLFFNPAVWWMSWRLANEREHACDEAVLRACDQPPLPYARALLELEAWRQRPSPALTLGLGGPGLRARVLRLVRPRRVRRSRRWAARAGVLGVVGLLVIALGWPTAAPTPALGSDPLGVSWLPASVRRHEDAIARAAERHGVDPGLLAIMVYTESRGRADARSSAGARGLMQIMPSTAVEIAQARGLPAPAPAQLDEPAYNLDMGAWYIARQLERHDDDLSLALAAYNAGPGRVAAYRRGEARLPEETLRYQATITALFRERSLPWSPTLAARTR
jgi:beta-lactamase regulating signal transducer with metallopeptidase domain